ncbi:MAG: hypothetical protein U2P59_01555 [Synergistota bacterium]|nr:hypothetical protein [Synergistota bacterium]
MLFSFFITLISGISFLLLVLTISLLLIGAENVLYDIHGTDSSLLAPYRRFLAGRCSDKCPPPLLFASCLSLILIFLFIPMGSLPQFVETEGDFVIMIFLLLASQGLYIRGMKIFSGEIYQSFDSKELFVLSKLAVTMIAMGGTLSWFALHRGMPGSIFSFETFTATSLWIVTGPWGKLGAVMFLLLLALVSPSRGVTRSRIVDNVQIPEIFDAIRSMLAPAMIVSVFFPMRLGIFLGLIGFKMYLVDFVLFWIKVLLVQLLLIPLASKAFRGTAEKWREKLESLPEIIIGASGIVFFMLDLYI